jgi:hypothetical protein
VEFFQKTRQVLAAFPMTTDMSIPLSLNAPMLSSPQKSLFVHGLQGGQAAQTEHRIADIDAF